MGYYAEIEVINFSIPPENVKPALAACNAMHADDVLLEKAHGGSYGGESDSRPVRDRRWYSFVPNPDPDKCWPDLLECVTNWGFDAEWDDEGGLIVLDRDYSKLGQEAELLAVLAPFVRDDFRLDCRGEDNTLWRWTVQDGELVEQTGHVVYVP
jgi:hypothetical protein